MRYHGINLLWFLVLWLYVSLPIWAVFYGFEWAHKMDAKRAAKRRERAI